MSDKLTFENLSIADTTRLIWSAIQRISPSVTMEEISAILRKAGGAPTADTPYRFCISRGLKGSHTWTEHHPDCKGECQKTPEMPGIAITSLGGNCPVQGEGAIDGKPFYFRARGNHWSLGIGGEDGLSNPEWTHREPWGCEPFEAGWMSIETAVKMINRGAALYRLRQIAI